MVIGIIGILASALLVGINPIGQFQKSRDSRRKSELKQIQTALELYRSDCGSYPAAVSSNRVPNPLTSSSSPVSGSCGTSGATYIQAVPNDPSGGAYIYIPSGSGYSLYACAEKLIPSNDSDIRAGNPPGTTCTKGNYFIFTNP